MIIVRREFYHYGDVSLEIFHRDRLRFGPRATQPITEAAGRSGVQQTLEALARMKIRLRSRTVLVMTIVSWLLSYPEVKRTRGEDSLVLFWLCRPEKVKKLGDGEEGRNENGKPVRGAIIIPIVCRRFNMLHRILKKYGSETTQEYITRLIKKKAIGVSLQFDEHAKVLKKLSDEATERAALAWHTVSLAENVERLSERLKG